MNSDKPTYEQLEERLTQAETEIKELHKLYTAATAIGSNLTLDDTLQSVVIHIADVLDSNRCTLSIWDRNRNQIENLIEYNKFYPEQSDKPGQIYDLRDYPSTLKVLETGHPLIIQVNDPKADKAEVELMRNQKIFSIMMQPLKSEHRILGLLEVYEDVESREYTKREIRVSESLAFQAAVALENAQLYESTQSENIIRKKTEKELEKKVRELEEALNDVKILKGLIPICASCKNIRDDSGYWNEVESYIEKHLDTKFTHGLCPDCIKIFYPAIEN